MVGKVWDAATLLASGDVTGIFVGDNVAEKSSTDPKKPTEPASIEGILSSTETRVTLPSVDAAPSASGEPGLKTVEASMSADNPKRRGS